MADANQLRKQAQQALAKKAAFEKKELALVKQADEHEIEAKRLYQESKAAAQAAEDWGRVAMQLKGEADSLDPMGRSISVDRLVDEYRSYDKRSKR